MSAPSLAEKPRKLLRWTDSSELEDVSRENTGRSGDDTPDRPGLDPSVLSRREDWYGAKMQRLKENVEQLRKELRNKERDYIRVKNKYNVSKRCQAQLQEDLQQYTDGKLDLDGEVEFLRLQLLEKDKELARQHANDGHFETTRQNGGHYVKSIPEEDSGVDEADETYFTEDSIFSRKYLSLHKESRKIFTYILLCVAVVSSLVALLMRSSFLSTIVVGLWTLGLSCLWVERKQLFRAFKLKYLKKIRQVEVENSKLRKENTKLESRATELVQKLANEKQERGGVILKVKALSDKLDGEKSKNEELVKLEKSTFEDLQGERVRRRRAEEQLEEVSEQVLSAREKDEVAKCGDVCRKLRDNALQQERESKEKLSRENERLIKEIVELNMNQEKERLEQEECNQKVASRNEWDEKKEQKMGDEMDEHVDAKRNEKNLEYTEERGVEQVDESEQGRVIGMENEGKMNKEANFGEENKIFDPKECESLAHECREDLEKRVVSSRSQTSDAFCQTTESGSAKDGVNTKDCWLCSWNIPNETSLAVLATIVACLVLALKVVLSSNVYMVAVFMTLVGCFTYYQVARNIENSN